MLRVAYESNSEELIFNWTNLWNKGLISVDRRTKPTLILTIPRSLFKSSTKDLSSAIFEIVIQSYDLECKHLSVFVSDHERWISTISSMDSDLEAFSHYPTDGSFAALPFQATAFTNYLNQRFLSY